MLTKAFKYLRFVFIAHSRRGHGIHSPFVYDLVSRVFSDLKDENLEALLKWRKQLGKDKTEIEESSFGAGSLHRGKSRKSVGKLVRVTGIPHKYGKLLYHLVREFKPCSIIELGTGMGISTAYLAMARPEVSVMTVEGSAERSDYARKFLERTNIYNIAYLKGEFSEHLPELVAKAQNPLLLIIDGNHKYKPIMNYFEIALKYANENTIIIFDDIHWSCEMEKAWREIAQDERVVLSIDLFRCGLVFFRRGMVKQHVLINY